MSGARAPLPDGDLPARLYHLLTGTAALDHMEEVTRLVTQALPAQLRAPSEWSGRQQEGGQYMSEGVPVECAAWASYATRGLSAIHVLAKHCTDVAVLRAAVSTVGTGILTQAGGFYDNGSPANNTPMHCAATTNQNVEVLLLLVELGGVQQLQIQDAYGWIAVHYAAYGNRNLEVLRALVELGGVEQLQAPDEDGNTPMLAAARVNRNPEMLRALVELGGVQQLQVVDDDGLLPIHAAAEANPNGEVFRTLVELGGMQQLQARDDDGAIAMHLAALHNQNVEVLRVLVELGGVEQMQARTDNGATPLHLASRRERSKRNVEMARFLLGRGCDRNPERRRHEVGGADNTPLACAMNHNGDDLRVATMLVEAGADTTCLDPLFVARLHHVIPRVSVSTVLSSYFADNVTPLGGAVRVHDGPPALRSLVAFLRIVACHTDIHLIYTDEMKLLPGWSCAATPALARWLPARPPGCRRAVLRRRRRVLREAAASGAHRCGRGADDRRTGGGPEPDVARRRGTRARGMPASADAAGRADPGRHRGALRGARRRRGDGWGVPPPCALVWSATTRSAMHLGSVTN
jgi:ankyrin repeat protein